MRAICFLMGILRVEIAHDWHQTQFLKTHFYIRFGLQGTDNSRITYSIVSVTPTTTVPLFYIRGDTGLVTVASPLTDVPSNTYTVRALRGLEKTDVCSLGSVYTVCRDCLLPAPSWYANGTCVTCDSLSILKVDGKVLFLWIEQHCIPWA